MLPRISEFINITGLQVNMYNQLYFYALSVSNWKQQQTTWNKISKYNTTKNIKYLGAVLSHSVRSNSLRPHGL